MEAVADHPLKRSLETQNVDSVQTERIQIFTTRGGEVTITFILSFARRQLDEDTHRQIMRWGWTEVGSTIEGIRFVDRKKEDV